MNKDAIELVDKIIKNYTRQAERKLQHIEDLNELYSKEEITIHGARELGMYEARRDMMLDAINDLKDIKNLLSKDE